MFAFVFDEQVNQLRELL